MEVFCIKNVNAYDIKLTGITSREEGLGKRDERERMTPLWKKHKRKLPF